MRFCGTAGISGKGESFHCAVRCFRRFLNRLLGLPVARQNLLFAYFEACLLAETRGAKAEGRYFEVRSFLQYTDDVATLADAHRCVDASSGISESWSQCVCRHSILSVVYRRAFLAALSTLTSTSQGQNVHGANCCSRREVCIERVRLTAGDTGRGMCCAGHVGAGRGTSAAAVGRGVDGRPQRAADCAQRAGGRPRHDLPGAPPPPPPPPRAGRPPLLPCASSRTHPGKTGTPLTHRTT